MGKKEDTPLIKQYFDIKKKHPDAILLFRVGDFYEVFGKDAPVMADILSIALTKKSNGPKGPIEMAGFPFHALDNFLPKLVRAGKRVAVCDQLEDPKLTKKLVKRDITELVTPGVSTNDNILNQKENNFLAGVHICKNRAGVSFLDISTGEFYTGEGSIDFIDKLITSFDPKEILYERGKKALFNECFSYSGARFEMEDWIYTEDSASIRLLNHFKTKNLKGFGIDNMPLGIIASGSLLYYLDITEHTHIDHIKSISKIEENGSVRLDKFTVKSLELICSMNDGGKSLFDVINKTKCPMGSRLLRKWILFPLNDIERIKERQDIVEYFFKNPELKDIIFENLSKIGDIERIVSKMSVGRVSPRDLVYLKNSLISIDNIIKACRKCDSDEFNCNSLFKLIDDINPCYGIVEKISKEIVDDPPIAINKGQVIKSGVNSELDELRDLSSSGKKYLLDMQNREAERTGISSLKIGFNNVFGYYIEVRNTYKDKVPEEWIRKQTLVSAERYITQELKEYEEKILGAEEKISSIEYKIYSNLVEQLTSYISILLKDANKIAQLDCLISFAVVASVKKYLRPEIFNDDEITIKEGRHPVIEDSMPEGEVYIPNDISIDSNKEQVMIITGPNMAGKSALLRQTALITIMAQTGSFVPAASAHIGIVDKIFTRVGASDNISVGESTFMVEMTEAANILNNMSARSLIIFDELGRGTSTYDGISIAWAIVEYIHENGRCRPKTLFATHYHELNEMQKYFPRIKNYHISVKETGGKVIFLRKLVKGGTNHSFGIHVAKMSGMPDCIVNRAGDILKELEINNQKENVYVKPASREQKCDKIQLSLFQLDDPVLSQVRDEILNVDIDNFTPIEALNKLNDIKKIVRGK